MQTGYVLPFYVSHKDSDFTGKLRFTALATYLQETAWAHATLMAIDYYRPELAGLLWVLSRMEVRLVGSLPSWRDTVFVQTYPVGIEKMFAYRDFLLYFYPGRHNQAEPGLPLRATELGDDALCFARVRSSWLIIDSQKRSIVRPQILSGDFSSFLGPAVFPEPAERIREPQAWQSSTSRGKAGYTDIDAHDHVNNVSYFEWALASYPSDWFRKHSLSRVVANFTAELGWDQDLVHRRCELSPLCDCHRLEAVGSDQASALLQFEWQAASE